MLLTLGLAMVVVVLVAVVMVAVEESVQAAMAVLGYQATSMVQTFIMRAEVVEVGGSIDLIVAPVEVAVQAAVAEVMTTLRGRDPRLMDKMELEVEVVVVTIKVQWVVLAL